MLLRLRSGYCPCDCRDPGLMTGLHLRHLAEHRSLFVVAVAEDALQHPPDGLRTLASRAPADLGDVHRRDFHVAALLHFYFSSLMIISTIIKYLALHDKKTDNS